MTKLNCQIFKRSLATFSMHDIQIYCQLGKIKSDQDFPHKHGRHTLNWQGKKQTFSPVSLCDYFAFQYCRWCRCYLNFFYCQRTPWEWQSDLIEALRTACNTSLSQAQQTQTNIQQPAVSVNMKTYYPTLKSQRCRRPQSETESDLKHELLLLPFCTLHSLSEHKLCKNKQTKIRKNSISVEAK